MNYSTIVGITVGTLTTFVIVLVVFAVYFPISPKLLWPFGQRKSVDTTVVILNSTQKENLVKEAYPLVKASSTLSIREKEQLKEEASPTQDTRPSLSPEQKQQLIEAAKSKI